MKVPAAKIEKSVSKDQTRPVLTSLYLRVETEATETEPGRGYLEGTDSYKLARVPVELDPGDVEGFVDPAAIVAARKADKFNPRIAANGALEVSGGPTFARAELGQFPNTAALIPENLWAPAGSSEPWEIGLNAKLLLELAQSLGSETVRISFCRPTPSTSSLAEVETDPSRLRPLTVRPLNGGYSQGKRGKVSDPDAIGILMPIRVGSA